MEEGKGQGERVHPSPGWGCAPPSPPRVAIPAHHNEKGPFLSPAQLLEKQTGVDKRETATHPDSQISYLVLQASLPTKEFLGNRAHEAEMPREARKGGPACQGQPGSQRQVQLRAPIRVCIHRIHIYCSFLSYVIIKRQGLFSSCYRWGNRDHIRTCDLHNLETEVQV